jgi:hypothetical protein
MGAVAYAKHCTWTDEKIFKCADILSKINGLPCGFSEK